MTNVNTMLLCRRVAAAIRAVTPSATALQTGSKSDSGRSGTAIQRNDQIQNAAEISHRRAWHGQHMHGTHKPGITTVQRPRPTITHGAVTDRRHSISPIEPGS